MNLHKFMLYVVPVLLNHVIFIMKWSFFPSRFTYIIGCSTEPLFITGRKDTWPTFQDYVDLLEDANCCMLLFDHLQLVCN